MRNTLLKRNCTKNTSLTCLHEHNGICSFVVLVRPFGIFCGATGLPAAATKYHSWLRSFAYERNIESDLFKWPAK